MTDQELSAQTPATSDGVESFIALLRHQRDMHFW
jgi:hypothetical protein